MAGLYLRADSDTKVVVMTMEMVVVIMATMEVTGATAIEDTGATVKMVSKAGMVQMAGEEVAMNRLYSIATANPGM